MKRKILLLTFSIVILSWLGIGLYNSATTNKALLHKFKCEDLQGLANLIFNIECKEREQIFHIESTNQILTGPGLIALSGTPHIDTIGCGHIDFKLRYEKSNFNLKNIKLDSVKQVDDPENNYYSIFQVFCHRQWTKPKDNFYKMEIIEPIHSRLYRRC